MRTGLVVMAVVAGVLGCRSEEPRFEAEEPARVEPPPSPAQPEPQAQPSRPAVPPAPVVPPSAVPTPGPSNPALLNPALANETAPATYAVELDTTKGPIVIDVTREWSPAGADRFYNLVRIGYFTDVAFFRVLDGFMAQGGLHGDPAVNRAWRNANIPDDPPRQSNTAGMVSYAMAGPGTRTTQFFISYEDNSRLDGMGFAPFGRVRDLTAARRLYSGYGEGAPRGRGPMQGRVQAEGNAYLRAEFPQLDYIRSARILP